MPLTITQRPDQFNNWSAAFNPVVFKAQRKDYPITAVTSSGGALRISVTGDLTTLTAAKGGAVVAGSVLWVATDNGVYGAAYTVVTCTHLSGVSTVTFGAGTYTAAATTGYINLQQRTGYNVQVRIFAGNGAVSSSSLFTMSFTPTKSGAILADVSQLKSYMSPQLWNNFGITNLSEAYKVRNNASTSLKAHIQYTEVWTSSAETETSDSANPFFVVYGARQVWSQYGGYLKEYSDATNRKFLTPFTQPHAWLNKPFTLSFIDPSPSGTTRTYVKKTRYYSNGSLWGSTYDLSDYSAGTPNPSVFESFEDLGIHYALLHDKQDSSGTISWTIPSYTGNQTITGTTGTSNNLIFPLYLTPNIAYSIVINVTVTTGAATINLSGKELNGTNRFSLSQSAPVGTYDLTFSGTPTQHTHFIGLSATFATSSTITINSITVHDIPQNGRIEYQLVTQGFAYYPITETVVSETLVVQVEDACTPSVHLVWKNHLGGDSSWCFDFNQTFTVNADKMKKIRSSKLYADAVTYNDVLGLSELVSSGEIYDVPVTELTSSVRDLQERSGANVLAFDDSGNYVGVVVKDSDISSDTSRSQHSISVTIQYPETIHPQ